MENNLHILIVDDVKLAHEQINKFLEAYVFTERHFTVTSAYNLTQAKRLLTEKKFALVMLDGDVGDGWGYEIIPDILKHSTEVKIVSSSNDDNFNTKSVSKGSHEAVNKKWVYTWNDEKAEYRKQKGQMIRELLAI